MSKTNDLIDFMHSLTREMGDEYNRIQKRSTEDPGTAGDQGEENWATIFRNWLPADYQVVTKGRLLSHNGIASPQIDVIILHPYYPKHLLDKKLYLTAGVAAVFECKNTLKSSHIDKAVQNAKEIRNLIDLKPSNFINELFSPIVYGLITHSHSWKSKGSKPQKNILNKLLKSDLEHIDHPRECLDFICVSDLSVWTSYKQPKTLRSITEKNGKFQENYVSNVSTFYGSSRKYKFDESYLFTPIGTFLSQLLRKLALTDKRLENFSSYFSKTVDNFSQLHNREWPKSTLSREAKTDFRLNGEKYRKEAFIGWMN